MFVYLSVSIERMMAYSIIALNMLKMQMTMYLSSIILKKLCLVTDGIIATYNYEKQSHYLV